LVEYASIVWNPYTKTEINKIEAVQRRAARYVVSNQRNRFSVSNMLQRLKWRPLANRRKDARLMLKGHNPGLKGFRCVQLHNVWWQQIPIPHCSWEK
jgi:hypothetical protein